MLRQPFQQGMGLIRYRDLLLGRTAQSWFSSSSSGGPKTLSMQDKLARLPVPELQHTVNKWLQTTKPHLTEQEWQVTFKRAQELLKVGGVGQQLQSILEHRYMEKENWFSDWWLDMAYLEYRAPLPVWSSPGLCFPKQHFKDKSAFLTFAAKMVAGVLDFKIMLDSESLPVETMGKQPLDMQQYYKLFGTTRVPCANRDTLHFNHNSDYIVVAHNGNFFRMPVYGKFGEWLSRDQIEASLKAIVAESEREGKGHPVGILTTDTRDAWSNAYEVLRRDNGASVDVIENSLFLLSLDPDSSKVKATNDMSRTSLLCLHGVGSQHCAYNRWYDKVLQFFVAESGENGLCNEHSVAEALPTMFLSDHCLNYVAGTVLHGNNLPAVDFEKPSLIRFTVKDDLQEHISRAEENHQRSCDDLEVHVFKFDHYGKEFVKSQKKSPDSFVQMAIQLAFYRLHKSPAATYESAGTRTFKHGRTDVIRSCSPEAVEFAKQMLDNSTSVANKYNSMLNAIQSHNKYAKMAVVGQAVDRHLQGLQRAAQENNLPVPDIFSDPGYKRSSHMRLSTSQISSTVGSFCSYGPLQQDGYACCYSLNPNDFTFAMSAMNSNQETSLSQFSQALDQSLDDLHDLCLSQSSKL